MRYVFQAKSKLVMLTERRCETSRHHSSGILIFIENMLNTLRARYRAAQVFCYSSVMRFRNSLTRLHYSELLPPLRLNPRLM